MRQVNLDGNSVTFQTENYAVARRGRVTLELKIVLAAVQFFPLELARTPLPENTPCGCSGHVRTRDDGVARGG